MDLQWDSCIRITKKFDSAIQLWHVLTCWSVCTLVVLIVVCICVIDWDCICRNLTLLVIRITLIIDYMLCTTETDMKFLWPFMLLITLIIGISLITLFWLHCFFPVLLRSMVRMLLLASKWAERTWYVWSNNIHRLSHLLMYRKN